MRFKQQKNNQSLGLVRTKGDRYRQGVKPIKNKGFGRIAATIFTLTAGYRNSNIELKRSVGAEC